jgi:HipA-like protein
MSSGLVYYNGRLAGEVIKNRTDDYRFIYEDTYFSDPFAPPISLTLLKNRKEHQSDLLFAFFAGLLAEGVNKDIQCRLLKIDEQDDFTRLLKTTGENTIGAITIKEKTT